MVYINCYVDNKFDNKMRLNRNILSDNQCKEQVDEINRYLFDVMSQSLLVASFKEPSQILYICPSNVHLLHTLLALLLQVSFL